MFAIFLISLPHFVPRHFVSLLLEISLSLSTTAYRSHSYFYFFSYQIFGRCFRCHCHHCRTFILFVLSVFSIFFQLLFPHFSLYLSSYFIHFLCWLVFLSLFLFTFYFHWPFVSLADCLGTTFSACNGMQCMNYFLIFEFQQISSCSSSLKSIHLHWLYILNYLVWFFNRKTSRSLSLEHLLRRLFIFEKQNMKSEIWIDRSASSAWRCKMHPLSFLTLQYVFVCVRISGLQYGSLSKNMVMLVIKRP